MNYSDLGRPASESRKSVALYLLRGRRDVLLIYRPTDYFAWPQVGSGRSTMIWPDKKSLDLCSRAKSRFGFSHSFASRY